MPEVSVIIPAYNQAGFLPSAIQSVLEQTFPDFDLIVVDDGSTDHTVDVVNSFQDGRLRYIYQENKGLSAARNTGIRSATSPFLTFLDSDDLYSPDKLEILLEEMVSRPDLGLVAGQAIPIDENGKQVGKIFDTPIPEDPAKLLLGNPLHVGSVLIRKDWQESVGFFDEELRSYEDWDMWLRLARQGCPMGWIEKPVSFYRFHTDQMTRIGNQMTAATFAVLEKTFSDTALPPHWKDYYDLAFSHAYLRAAAQAYHTGDFPSAKKYISEAVIRNPELVEAEGQKLAEQFLAWTDLPKIKDPMCFLEQIYANLPEDLIMLRRHRRRNLSQAAIQDAFESHKSGDYERSLSALKRAVRYRPGWLLNRGVAAILVRSFFTSQNETEEVSTGK